MVEFQIQNGIHGLVPCGTTGETPAMGEEEDRLVIGTVVRVANGRVPVIAGTGSNSTDMAIKYTKDGRRGRGRWLLAGLPLLQQADPGGPLPPLRRHSREHELPIILYNIPGRTSVTIDAETTARLAEIRTSSVRRRPPSHDMAMDVMSLCGEDFDVLSGDDPVTLPLMLWVVGV
jgi:4-hydroxy-tetrahydrodipicolinate synthase